MKIRLLVAISGNEFSWAAGDVVDLPEATARGLADGVRAELVDAKRETRVTREQPDGETVETAATEPPRRREKRG